MANSALPGEANGCASDSGLWHERTKPRQPFHACRRRQEHLGEIAELLRMADRQYGQQDRRPGIGGRGDCPYRGTDANRVRAVGQGPERHGRLPSATSKATDANTSMPTASCTPATSPVDHAGGWFTIVDRIKELIKYKGYQVRACRTRGAAADPPANRRRGGDRRAGRREARRSPRPSRDPSYSQRGPHRGGSHASTSPPRVAPHKKMRRVEFIDVIPKSATGKDPPQGVALTKRLITAGGAGLAVEPRGVVRSVR